MKTKIKTPKKAENSKTLEAMKLYVKNLRSLDKISDEDVREFYKHIQFAENHPEILALADADAEKKLKKQKEEREKYVEKSERN